MTDRPTIDGWLAGHARHRPHHPALSCGGRVWDYAALDAWVGRLAAWLTRSHGVGRGDRVAYLGQNSAAEVALFFAAARLGAMVVPLNWRLSAEELGFVLDHAEPRLLIHGAEMAERAATLAQPRALPCLSAAAAERPPETRPEDLPPTAALEDPLFLVYTSGSTGRPKGVVLTQEAVLWTALNSLHAQDLTAADHVLNVLPLFHVGGINIQMMPAFLLGARVTLHSSFEPGAVIAALADEAVTLTVVVPTAMRALLAHPSWASARFPALRLINTGSTDVPVDILRAVNDRGIPMVQVYGATETGPIASYQRAEEARATIGSIGRPALHTALRLVRPDGAECATDEPGEIWLKGPNTFRDYWRDPAATAAARQDGWFKTGDMARRDADGLLWFVGRLKHVIISGGENIYPAEIERLYASHPDLAELAVVGRPDPRWGEVPVLAAVAKPGHDPSAEALLAVADGRLARFKRPKAVVFLDRLPRNALGKVVVPDLRATIAEKTALTSA